MPIKPENKARYPSNWKEIRKAILERAKHKCEQCSVSNGQIIVRGTGKDAGTFQDSDANVFYAETGKHLGRMRMSEYCGCGKGTTIVLTIAHLDHTPENCDPVNLKALCQRCHLAYDAEHHKQTAHETRRNRLALGDLFTAT